MSKPQEILSAWKANSNSWIQAINKEELASRTAATNAAIVNAINVHQPNSILDLGCGEGWLCRALVQAGRKVVGIDGVPSLVEDARNKDQSGTYYCHDYDAIRKGALSQLGPFDVITFNFALFEEQGTAPLLSQLRHQVTPTGSLVFQTVILGDKETSGWRQEDWQALERDFPAPFPWYYRTPKDWEATLQESGWNIDQMDRILHPESGALLSLIIHAKRLA